jgi:hypothetical protein
MSDDEGGILSDPDLFVASFHDQERTGFREDTLLRGGIEGTGRLQRAHERALYRDPQERLREQLFTFYGRIKNMTVIQLGGYVPRLTREQLRDTFDQLPHPTYKNPYFFVLAALYDDALTRSGPQVANQLIWRILELTQETWIAETDVIRYYRLLLRQRQEDST